jgi:hypothetical protein
MASTRTARTTQDTQTADVPKDAVVALARGAARVQVAACVMAATSFAGWAQAADRFAQRVGGELLRRVDGETDSATLLARLAHAASSHLRELTELPRTAADHFDAQLAPRATANER